MGIIRLFVVLLFILIIASCGNDQSSIGTFSKDALGYNSDNITAMCFDELAGVQASSEFSLEYTTVDEELEVSIVSQVDQELAQVLYQVYYDPAALCCIGAELGSAFQDDEETIDLVCNSVPGVVGIG